VGLDLCYEKLLFIFHIEKIAIFFLFEIQKMVFHSLDLNPSAVIQQVRIEMKIKLMTDRNNSAPPELLVFNVEKIEGIKVSVC
jgi:uncharacterized secreted protein with C-terminal beta-propeller domain